MNRRRRTDEPVKNIHKETEYHTVVTDDGTQDEGFNCKACGKFITVRDCGTNNRNHCPHCLSSIHLDFQKPVHHRPETLSSRHP